MTHEADFLADIRDACDDARLSVTAIGSILIDEGHKWLALASVGRNAERQDHEDGLGPKDEHAVGSVADETPDV